MTNDLFAVEEYPLPAVIYVYVRVSFLPMIR